MMHRRDFLKSCGAGARAAWAVRAWPATDPRPNVLVIQCDELNLRALGCYRALLPPEEAFVWGPGVSVETPPVASIARGGAMGPVLGCGARRCSARRPGRHGQDPLSVRPESVGFAC